MLALLAGAGWLVCLAVEISLAAGNASLAIWLTEMTDPLRPYAFWIGIVPFAAFAAAISALGSYRWRTTYRSIWVAMRGAPRWLGMAMLATILLTAISLVWTLLVSPTLPASNARLFPASIISSVLAVACCQFVSAARLGLGEQRCENGHPLGRDMTRCSLCDAPARGVLLFTP